MRRVSAFVLAAALGAGLCAMSGCASKAAEAPTETSSASEAQQAPMLEIGSEGTVRHAVVVTNETGKAVTAVAFMETGAAEYTDLPFGDGAEWADGEKAELNIPALASDAIEDDAASDASAADAQPGAADAAAGGEADARDDVMLRSQIDLKLAMDDGSVCELHGIAPDGLAEAALRLDAESGLAYLVYTGEDGVEENTLATEKAYLEQKRAQEEAAAQAAAAEAQAAAAAAEQQAREAASQEAAQQSKGAGSQGGGSSKSSPSYSAPSGGSQGGGSAAPAPRQSEDQCVEGGVAFRD